jgi:hypothetical protein
MAEGVNGGPARFYRRLSLAEQREAAQITSAEVAVLEARAERVTADAEVRVNKLDLQILKLKQKEARASARKRSNPTQPIEDVAIGSGPPPPTYKSRENDPNATRLAPV